jgi:hypothetical protein
MGAPAFSLRSQLDELVGMGHVLDYQELGTILKLDRSRVNRPRLVVLGAFKEPNTVSLENRLSASRELGNGLERSLNLIVT